MDNGSSVSKDSTKEQFIVKLPLSSQVPRDFGVPKDWALSNDHLDLDRGLRTGIVHQKHVRARFIGRMLGRRTYLQGRV
jgi:hypothetical protein